jgi:deoxyhypusine synthase
MIRNGKVHAISCTGANLEEDIYNLVAHEHYERIPNWRGLTVQDEQDLYDRHLNRVTDTCIPEEEAMRKIWSIMADEWKEAEAKGERCFPHEFFYRALLKGKFAPHAQIDPKNSWMLAAAEKNLPMVVPGWEDSTLGNMYASFCMRGEVKNVHTVKTGIEYMTSLAEWYMATSVKSSIGFFQIGGGIAGLLLPDL